MTWVAYIVAMRAYKVSFFGRGAVDTSAAGGAVKVFQFRAADHAVLCVLLGGYLHFFFDFPI